MYKFFLIFLLFFSLPSLSKEEKTVDYPYLEMEQLMYNNHLSFDIEKWNPLSLFDRFIDELDPYKVVFSEESLSEISHLRTHFYGVIFTQELRNKTLQPVYEFYLKEYEKFLVKIKKDLKNVNLEYYNTNNILFEISPKSYVKTNLDLNKRINNFAYYLIINELIEGKDLDKLKEDKIFFYENMVKYDEYKKFNYLLLNVIAESMDPHTSYLSPVEQSNFMIDFNGVLNGGIGISFEYDRKGRPIIKKILEDGPVHKEGSLKIEDVITGFSDDGEHFTSFSGLPEHSILESLRGEVGEKIYLSYNREGKTGVALIIREVVQFKKNTEDRIEYKEIKQDDKNLGYIKIPLFYDNFNNDNAFDVSYDVSKLIDENEEDIDGLIIDLRNNGGGSLNACLKLLDLFLSDKVLLQVKYPLGTPHVFKSDAHTDVFDKPLIVYINGKSASASEIFAGVIQDHGRGVIIGAPSYGKGTVQTVVDLGRGQINLTTSQFFLPSGRSTQEKGVTPDIIFPTKYPQRLFGEISLENHIKYDELENYVENIVPFYKKPLPKFDFKNSGLAELQNYYTLVNKFIYENEKIPLNISLREEEVDHFYHSQIKIINNYLEKNNKPLITSKSEINFDTVDIDQHFHDISFEIINSL